MEPAELLKLAVQVSIMLTVFGFGLGATVEDVLYLVRHPRKLLISLVSMFIVMPFIALALVLVFDPPQVARVALVALALSPVPPVLLTRQRKAGGRASYGLGLTAAVSILSIVLLPALVAFLGRIMDKPFEMGPAAVAGQVVVAVVLPLAAGMLVRAFPRLAQVLTFGTRGPRRLYGVGVGLRPHFGRTGPWGFGGAGSRERGEASGRRLGNRGRELPFAGRRGGDYPVSAHRSRRMHSLHEVAAKAHGGLAARGPEGARVRPRAFPRGERGGRPSATRPRVRRLTGKGPQHMDFQTVMDTVGRAVNAAGVVIIVAGAAAATVVAVTALQ
jgi:hypothetical protein